ncbi:MAG: hypothetical protein DDT21_02139 [Syntrophomonadaceae bacterium]|nr:hypothetical protein [Bacillota bacterium]
MSRSLRVRLQDFEDERSGLSIDMQCWGFYWISIRFNTPFGAINLSPQQAGLPGVLCEFDSIGVDAITKAIREGMEKRSLKILTGSAKPFFNIEISAGLSGEGYEDGIFIFTMRLDPVAICKRSGSTSKAGITLSVFVNRKNIEEFISFLQELKKARDQGNEAFPQLTEIIDGKN